MVFIPECRVRTPRVLASSRPDAGNGEITATRHHSRALWTSSQKPPPIKSVCGFMAAPLDSQSQQKFLFVDVSASRPGQDSTKTQNEIRSHVMFDHVRQKRIQRSEYLKKTTPFPYHLINKTIWRTSQDTPLIPASRTTLPRTVPPSTVTQSNRDPTSTDGLLGEDNWLASPLSALSTFRRDSLCAYPVKLSHDGHALVDLWLTNFPRMTQLNLSPDIENIYRPTRNIFFPLAMSSPAAFETTVLHFAALHRAKLRGVQNDPHVIFHRTKSLRMTQQRVQAAIMVDSKTTVTDEDLVAVLSLATAECRLGDKGAAEIHLQGVRQLIRSRRQHGQVPNNHKLELLFNWYNINTEISSHGGAKTSPRVFQELRDDFENFKTMMNNFRSLAITQFETPHLQSIAPRVFSTPRLNSCLRKILICPTPDSPFYTHFSFQMCRFLVLMHVHMALYFFRNNVELAEQYLKRLTILTIEIDLEFRTNPVFLLAWALISDPELHDSLRYWFTNRISVMFKLLSPNTRTRASNYLLALLQLAEDEKGSLILPDLDMGVLEREVLHFEVPTAFAL